MVEIVLKNVDQTATLPVTGLMESVNLAAVQDGKVLTVTQVITFIIIPVKCISYIAIFIILFFFHFMYNNCNVPQCPCIIISRLYMNVKH